MFAAALRLISSGPSSPVRAQVVNELFSLLTPAHSKSRLLENKRPKIEKRENVNSYRIRENRPNIKHADAVEHSHFRKRYVSRRSFYQTYPHAASR
jgi:hypothetical protein